MARTDAGARLTERHRLQQLALRAGSLQDLLLLWRSIDPTDLRGTIDVFVQAAVALTRTGARDSAGLSAGYYRLFRDAEGIPGALAAPRLLGVPSASEAAAAVRGASLAGIVNARRAGMSVDLAARQGFVRAAGAVTKLILTGGRQTLIGTAATDPKVKGWSRVASGSACAFCRMLASRGPAYGSQRTAGFEAHDGCGCSVEVAYDGSRPAPGAREFARQFTAAQQQARADGALTRGTSNDALNAFRRSLSTKP